jgi:hypothetical protein
MGRIRVFAVVLALGSVILGPIPAHAGSVWDANDPGHRLDIRWVGAYQQADGRMRVTVAFYDRVRIRWFNGGRDPSKATLGVGFTDDYKRIGPYFFALFVRNRHGGLSVWLCESGSSCSGPARVGRPDGMTIRARIQNFDYGPAPGWDFRGLSQTKDLKRVIDRTHWAVFT